MKNQKWIKVMSMVLTLSLFTLTPLQTLAAQTDATAVVEEEKTQSEEQSELTEDTTQNSSEQSATDTNEGATSDSTSDTSNDATSDTKDTSSETTTESSSETVSGGITVDESKDVSGSITVEEDKHDDQVEIQEEDKPYLSLGQNLTLEQQQTVLTIMGISATDLSNYHVSYVNNEEEHQYLGDYIDASKIGTKSLSSVVIVGREKGNGIKISTSNISYCTVGMYKNALATAGITDADIIVAAPFAISGTAALVGIFKAYSEMTGETIEEENIDAALNEIVVTGQLTDATDKDSDEIEGLIAYIKQQVVEQELTDPAKIATVIDEAASKFEVTLTEDQQAQLVSLMEKIGSLDLDVDDLLNAAQSVYDQISALTGDGGFFDQIFAFFERLIAKIVSFFSN